MRVKMCSIHVNDPAEAFEFYVGTLGFMELLSSPEHNLYIVKSADPRTDVGLLLEPSDNSIAADYMKGLHDENIPVIVFGVEDVGAEYERLTALGVVFTSEPETGASGTSAIFDDTCGNLIQIHQD
jgi:predicted enzyme related to lactoylglutathione lyase